MNRTGARWISAIVAAGLVSFATMDEAEAQQLRFETTAPGGIASTGNTLGLAKAIDENGPGTSHSIGTFITTQGGMIDDLPANDLNPWFAGTTGDWTQNGSTAHLQLPQGATVLHAELVWAGSWDYYPENVEAYLDTEISLSAAGTDISVSPDPVSALTTSELSGVGFYANYYLRSADVTSFVQQHLAESYTVSGVPATQSTLINGLSAAGWTLVVAYRHDDNPIRNLSIFVGGSFVDEDTSVDYTIDGFCAPPNGEVAGNVVISALEGDANLTGEDLAIGDGTDFVSLSGPNNPENNFFCSQINDDQGELATNGSFGDRNHDAMNGVNVSGARQGWDLTTIAVSSNNGHIANDQTQAVLRTTTVGDSYFPVLAAFELDVTSPDFGDSMTSADTDAVQSGDQITLTTTLTNDGEALADTLVLSLPIDSGLVLTGFTLDGQSGDANGQPVDAASLTSGIQAGSLDVGELRTVILSLEVVAAPENGTDFVFAPKWEHSFYMCSADAPINEAFNGPQDSVQYLTPPDDGGTGGAPPIEPPPANEETPGEIDDPVEEGSCACTAVGDDNNTAPANGLALLAIGAALGLRRRRN
jgi:MYXO-CTERM domain-containing protein/uncharacterized repeat protein (TIGR01451 family)